MTLTDQICSQPSIQIPVSRVEVEVAGEVEPPTVEHVILFSDRAAAGAAQSGPQGDSFLLVTMSVMSCPTSKQSMHSSEGIKKCHHKTE